MELGEIVLGLLPTIFAALTSAVVGAIVALWYRRGRPRVLVRSCGVAFGYDNPTRRIDVSEQLQKLSKGSALVDDLEPSESLVKIMQQSLAPEHFLKESESAIKSIDRLIAGIKAEPKLLKDKIEVVSQIARESVVESWIIGGLQRKEPNFSGIDRPPKEACNDKNKIIDVYEDARDVGTPKERHGYILRFPTFGHRVYMKGKEAGKERSLFLPYVESMKYFHSGTLLALLSATRSSIQEDTDDANILKTEFDKVLQSSSRLRISVTIVNEGRGAIAFQPRAAIKIKLGATTRVLILRPCEEIRPELFSEETQRVQALCDMLKIPLAENTGAISINAKSFWAKDLVSEEPVSTELCQQMHQTEPIIAKIVLGILSPEIFETKFVTSDTFLLNVQAEEKEKAFLATQAEKTKL